MGSLLLAESQAEFAVLAAQCADLRSQAQMLCSASKEVRAHARALAVLTRSVRRETERWPLYLPLCPSPAEASRPLPIGGGEATEIVLRDYIAATCLAPGDEALDRDEPLLANGILDSLGILRLAAFIEETFGVAVPDDALLPEHFGSVRRVAALVGHLEAQRAAAVRV